MHQAFLHIHFQLLCWTRVLYEAHLHSNPNGPKLNLFWVWSKADGPKERKCTAKSCRSKRPFSLIFEPSTFLSGSVHFFEWSDLELTDGNSSQVRKISVMIHCLFSNLILQWSLSHWDYKFFKGNNIVQLQIHRFRHRQTDISLLQNSTKLFRSRIFSQFVKFQHLILEGPMLHL